MTAPGSVGSASGHTAVTPTSHPCTLLFFQSSTMSLLTHSRHWIWAAKRAIGLSMSTVFWHQKQHDATCCGWPLAVDLYHVQETCNHLTSLTAEIPRKVSVPTPVCLLGASRCPCQILLCDLPHPLPWVVFLHFLTNLRLRCPAVTLLFRSLHWTCILLQIFEYLQTHSPGLMCCQSVQPTCQCLCILFENVHLLCSFFSRCFSCQLVLPDMLHTFRSCFPHSSNCTMRL